MAALALLPVLLGLLAATAWSAVVRSRTADPVRRAQLRWLALGGLLVPATLLLCWTSYLLLGGADLVLAGLALTYELATAVGELRRIAHGLRPSSLDDGLGPALRRLATTVPLPVELDVCPEPLPDDIATTAYYVASEAVSNAIKHADADTIAVRVARDAGRLQVSVRDDGRGGASARTGARGWPGSPTGSPPRVGRCRCAARRGAARSSRRCCRARRDRRGLRAVPPRADVAAGGRRARGRRRRR